MNTNLVEELKWRGMIHDIMPGTEEQLKKEVTKGVRKLNKQLLSQTTFTS